MKVKNNNYILIQGFMVNELKLKGNELLVYAIIYGFSQDGESEFEGSRGYLADWLSVSLPTIDLALKKLIDKELIEKTIKEKNNIRFSTYKISLQGIKKLYRGYKETLQGGYKETLHNNTIYNNTNINIKENIIKEKYGEFKNVLLTKEEYEKIKEAELIDYIEKVSSYVASTGKKYKSHYATILNWARKEKKTPQWFNKEFIKDEATEEERQEIDNIINNIS